MKKTIYAIFLIGVACLFGNVFANVVAGTEGLNWLSLSKGVSITPSTFNFYDFFSITFGFEITLNVAQVILIIAAIIVYTKTAPKLFAK